MKMQYTKDPDGGELLLKDGKYQVMMEWEKPYMHACIDALQPSGDVLEIGFGLGYSADRIQTYPINSHTIIECDETVLARARSWAKTKPNVKIIAGTWQEVLPTLGQYDTIFFDDYPLTLTAPSHAEELAKIASDTAQYKPSSYTDQDIQYLLDNMQGADKLPASFYETFFTKLLKDKQITHDQYNYIFAQLKITPQPPMQDRGPGDRLIEFLKIALRNHLRPSGRFSCYLEHTESLYQYEPFRNLVINDPFLDFHEHTIPVSVSPHCKYFKGNHAYVIVITCK
ncbi:MAG: class I SAM-dependent methyltransferase [Chlamydiia bacterium]|nr:class I SAM-dependent methyltransferase [Chlamydiia bacterium]